MTKGSNKMKSSKLPGRLLPLALLVILVIVGKAIGAQAFAVYGERGDQSAYPGETGPQPAALQSVRAQAAVTDTLSQFGITWTLDLEYEYGQFANGDYWVIGPVTVTAISPASVLSGTRTMNGSMINPSPTSGAIQGYDSSMYGQYGPYYDPALNAARPNNQPLSAANPLILPPGSSLVSTISHHEAGVRPQLQTAAVLTVLAAPPPTGSFRPPYSGSDKTIRYNVSQINAGLLKALSPVASTPELAEVERYFERPWIDHVPNWLSDYLHPSENLPYYSREISTRVGSGALMLHLNVPNKDTLLIRYLQVGIDLYGVAQDGGEHNWVPNGGHSSGRKWPILFAGLMLDDADMQNIGPGDGSGTVYFGEDAQTFYVSQVDIDMTHDPDLRGCYLEEYAQSDLGLVEWGIRHATEPDQDNKAWCAIYRRCCTANAWAGFVLSALIMDVQELWAHDPLFDYQDRYMALQPPGDWTRCQSDFTEEMWDTYRDEFGRDDLELWGLRDDQVIHLSWRVNNVTLPTTSTWRIDYTSETGTVLFPPISIPTNTVRSHTLTGLTNYVWYTVTLNAMLDASPILTDSVRVMPTDRFIYLPLILSGS
jgi:hypothetical protein